MDYKKWDDIDECTDGEDSNEIESLHRIKLTADQCFEECVEGNTQYGYKKAADLYMHVVRTIKEKSISEQCGDVLVSCMLNAACCFIKLSEYDMCIDVCENMRQECRQLQPIQQMKCTYFLASALMRSDSSRENACRAYNLSCEIQNIIHEHRCDLDDSSLDDYTDLHASTCSRLGVPVIASKFGRTKGVHDGKNGWTLLSEEQWMEAGKWFTDALVAKSGRDVSSLYEGLARAADGMRAFDKASVSYEKAAESLISCSGNNDNDETSIERTRRSMDLMLLSANASLKCYVQPKNEDAAAAETERNSREAVVRANSLFSRVLTFSSSPKFGVKSDLHHAAASAGVGRCLCLMGHPLKALPHFQNVVAAAPTLLADGRIPLGYPSNSDVLLDSYKYLVQAHIALNQTTEALDTVDGALSVLSQLEASGEDTAEGAILKCNLGVYFLTTKSCVMQSASCCDLEELDDIFVQLCEIAQRFVRLGSLKDAYKTYQLCGEHYMKLSKISPFVLDDNILHTENFEGIENSLQAVELMGYAARHCEELLVKTKRTMLENGNDELVVDVHELYMDGIRLHYLRGVCASSRGAAQRCLERAHSLREEYDKLRSSSDGTMHLRFESLVIDGGEVARAYRMLQGDVHFHLAYTYMRSGKIKYAIEEARAAVVQFDSLSAGKGGKDHDTEQRERLRHAWGLVAVVACSMGEGEEARAESQRALRKVKELDIGPVQDSTEELHRLEKVLALNKHCCNVTETDGSVLAVNSSHTQRVLAENWASVTTSSPSKSETIAPVSEQSKSYKGKIPSISSGIDFNLMFAYFVISVALSLLLMTIVEFLFYDESVPSG